MELVFYIIVLSIVFLAVASGREIVRKRRLLAFFTQLNCDELHLVPENAEAVTDSPADRPAQVLEQEPLDAISSGSRTKTIRLNQSELFDPKNPFSRMMKLAGVQKLPCKIRYEHGRFAGEFTGKRTY